jgi:hypothetical protein
MTKKILNLQARKLQDQAKTMKNQQAQAIDGPRTINTSSSTPQAQKNS